MKKNINIALFGMFQTILFTWCVVGFAQSATVTGVVYENNQSKVSFKTPNGKITIYLPDDMAAGDVITGRVIDEPSGKNEKEQIKNLKSLLQYKLTTPDGMPIETMSMNNPVTKPFKVSTTNNLVIELRDKDNKTVDKTQVPTLPLIPVPTAANTSCTLAKKVIANTEPLVLLQSSPTVGAAPQVTLKPYYNVPVFGKTPTSYSLEVIAESPRKIIYALPKNISGMFNVCIQSSQNKSKKTDLINIVDINASIGKTNLLKGEKTQLTVRVTGLEGCPYRPVQLEISNNTTSVIQLQNGNQQLIPINTPLVVDLHQPFTTDQNVIGQIPGNFIINTTLHAPVSAYANPVQPYLAEIKTPDQFNLNMKALEQDINNYLTTNAAPYLQQVKEQLPKVTDIAELDKAKSQVSNMLNPLCSTGNQNAFLNNMNELNKFHPGLAAETKIPQAVHPLHDLAGEFDATTKILKIKNDSKESLLQYLGAKKSANGNYSFALSNGIKMVTYNNISIVIDPNQQDSACIDDGLTVPAKEEKKDEPVPPKDTIKTGGIDWADVTTRFTDSTGRKYRFYKNAECKILDNGFNIECKPQRIGAWDPVAKVYKDTATGKFERWEFQPHGGCLKGSGFCTEMMQIRSVQFLYDDKDCKRLIEVIKYEGFSCQ